MKNDSMNIQPESSERINTLFKRVKELYKCAENNGCIDEAAEGELCRIQGDFNNCEHEQGVLFCIKALSIIHEKRGDLVSEISEKVNHYEKAHDCINNAIVKAIEIKWNQPSLLKRQGIIKSKLGDALHQIGEHYEGNILEADAFRSFSKMLHSHPDYAEGILARTTASYSKTKWTLRKMLCDLTRAEKLFDQPKHTKHLPEATELIIYKNQIEELRSTIDLLLAITH